MIVVKRLREIVAAHRNGGNRLSGRLTDIRLHSRRGKNKIQSVSR